MNSNHVFSYQVKLLPFSYKNKLNNSYGLYRWKRKFKRTYKNMLKCKMLKSVKYIKKTFILTNFFLYKTNLLTTSYFGTKKCKSSFLHFIKNSNVKQLKKELQIKKNINFLKEHVKY